MIKKRPIVVLDTETTGLNPYENEIIQLAAVTVDPIRLELVENSELNLFFRPLKTDKISDEALRINKRTREELSKFPDPKISWSDFKIYMQNLKSNWRDTPMLCGHNIEFDIKFLKELCKLYGPWDTKNGTQSLFHYFAIDTMQLCFFWFENKKDVNSVRLDTIRDYIGIDLDGAHEAMNDVKATTEILIRFLKLHRNLSPKIKFKNESA